MTTEPGPDHGADPALVSGQWEQPTEQPAAPRERRPFIERLGLAAIAALLAALFGGVAVAAWVGGEVFLCAMGAIGCLMTAWVGVLTLVRS